MAKATRRGATPLDNRPRKPEKAEPKKPAAKRKKLPRPRQGGLLSGHLLALQSAWKRLRAAPLPTFMTVMVIAIALSLPAAMHLLIKNAKVLGGNVENTAQMSLFLEERVTEGQAKELQSRLVERSEIQKVDFISREQALEEFRNLSGFSDALASLDNNPLPHVLVVYPQVNEEQLQSLNTLRQDLQALPQVALAQLDMQWLQRLVSIINILERSGAFISLFLTLAVVVVVGNTIRLLSQSYRDEIEVFKLVGATDAFVRRPFLYSGLLYGLIGSLAAVIIVTFGVLWISGPLEELALLYHSGFSLQGLTLSDASVVLATGLILGLGGSWASVSRFLKELDL